MTDPESSGIPGGQVLSVFLAGIIGVSLIGFLAGTRTSEYDLASPLHVDASAVTVGVDGIQPARSYTELRETARGQSTFPQDLETIGSAVPGRDEPAILQGNKQAALDARAARRAYHGAPPVIPHPVQQGAYPECRACHENGVRIGAKRAPAYPHPQFESCTQCHAMDEPDLPWGRRSEGLEEDPRRVPNSFAGLEAPKRGVRWTGIAPPAIPHATFMHERCASCHGPNGRDPMKSSHPERQNCEQCHTPRANLEWRPGGR